MKIECSQFDNLLMEGDAFSMRVAEQHAATCAACAESLRSWNEISTAARGMQTTWDNATLLPRIQRAIANERQRTRSTWWQIAAAIAIFAGLAGVMWKTYRINHEDQFILQSTVLDQVERAEQQHVAAIQQLEKVTYAKLDDPSTPLLVSYKEKLMLLDDAIAQCQTAIDQNRANAHLRKQLLAVYEEKQRTLQDVLREEQHVENR